MEIIVIEGKDYKYSKRVAEELTINDLLNRFNSALSEEEINELLNYEN